MNGDLNQYHRNNSLIEFSYLNFSITFTLFEEINSTPHNNLGHSNCLSVKAYINW